MKAQKLLTSDNPKIHQLKKIAGYIFPFLLTLVFLYVAFRDVNISEALDKIAHISVFWFFMFVIVFVLSHYIRALRHKYILNSVKPDASVWNLFGALMVGYGVNFVVPRLGELYRALFVGRWEKISRTSTLGTIIVERVIDLLALVISVLISVMIYTGDLYTDITWLKSSIYILGLIIIGIIVFLVLLVKLKARFYNIILKFVSRFSKKIAEKLAYVFHMLVDGFGSLKGTKNISMTIFLSALMMAVYALNALLGFYLIGMDRTMEVTYAMAWVLMTISAFGIIIPTPGGTGSYHTINMFVLVAIFGFSKETGAAYALLTHLISMIIFILSALGSVYLVNKRQVKAGGSRETFFTVFKKRTDEL